MTEPTAVETLAPETDPAITASALRKASLRLIPLLALGYGTAYMDRVNISYASLQMNRDLHLSNTVYGFGAGLFFVSYAACEIPSNLLLYRFGARRWLARIMVTWGLIAIAMLFVRTPLQFYAARFFLGMAEAGFFPGVAYYLMQWFPAEMRARSVAGFYIAAPLSSVFMGAVAGALLNLNGRLGLSGWQWLFFIEALPAVILGIIYLLYLPDTPAEAKWLTPRERAAILSRIHPPSPHSHSIWPVLRNPRIWLYGLFMFCMLGSAYAYNFSAPAILVKVTGYSITRVGFILSALNVGGALAMLINGTLSDRSRAPFAYLFPGCFAMSAGFLALGLARTPFPAITGLFMLIAGLYSMQGPLWAVSSSFLSGRSAAAAIAAMNTIGILGGFFGPYFMGFARDLTGDYQRGLLLMTLPVLFGAGILFYLRASSPSHLKTPVPIPAS